MGTDDQRVTARGALALPFDPGDGQLVTLEADARGDVYHVDNDRRRCRRAAHYVERGIPYVGARLALAVHVEQRRRARLRSSSRSRRCIAQPYGGNPPGLPIEDSGAFEFDDNNLFSFDQLPGYDLVESGPRANVGLHAPTRSSPPADVEALHRPDLSA